MTSDFARCLRPAHAAAALFAGLLGLAAAVSAQPAAGDEADAAAGEEERIPVERLPALVLTPEVLYGLLIGEIAAQRGLAPQAAQTYLELARRTRDPRIAQRAVEIASFARMQEIALEAARLWYAADPVSLRPLQTLAALLVATRRVEEAEPLLARLLETDAVAPANGFMQLEQFLAGNPDKAANLRLVQRLAARHPKLAHASYAIARAAVAARDDQLALAAIRRAAELRPEWELPALFEAQILQRGSGEAAAKRLAAFLDKSPDARDVRLAYARLLAGERRLPEARAQFERLLAEHPDSVEVVYAVGLLAAQMRDYEVAEKNLVRLLGMNPRDPGPVLFTLGQIAEDRRDWAGAMQWYGRIERGEQLLPARLRIAQVLGRQGRIDEARQLLAQLEPRDAPERNRIAIAEAQLLREASRHREAFELLGRALEKAPDDPDLLYDQALTAERIDRLDVLEANLRRVIKLRPDHAHAYNALGYTLADRNLRLDEARRLIERALELAPDDYHIIDSLGWVLFRQGDLDGALKQLQRAYRGLPDGEIGAHLGEVLWSLGRREEAARVWDEALKAHPDNEVLQRTLKRLRP